MRETDFEFPRIPADFPNYSARDDRINSAGETRLFHSRFLFLRTHFTEVFPASPTYIFDMQIRSGGNNAKITTHLRIRVYPTVIVYGTPGFRENYFKEKTGERIPLSC